MNTTAEVLRAHLLGSGPIARVAPYRLVELTGPDAGDFLQRLCTQDVQALADGSVAPAAFLDAKGKLLVTCLVFRLGTSFWLETQAPQQPRLLALLERFHFTEKLQFAARPMVCVEQITHATSARGAAEHGAGGELVVDFARRGVGFRRRHSAVEAQAEPAAADPDIDDRAECLRMLAGLVRVGVETEPTTLALEADLDDHCSTTKGCYTGQEIVARIHTYGHVNRKLCLLRLAAGERITAPQPLHEPEDGVPVGRVMHAIPIPGGERPGQEARLGLGYLPQDFQAAGTTLALADGTSVEVLAFAPSAD